MENEASNVGTTFVLIFILILVYTLGYAFKCVKILTLLNSDSSMIAKQNCLDEKLL